MYRLLALGALALGMTVAGCASGGGSYDAGGGRLDGGGKPEEGDGGPSCLGELCGEECVDLQRDVAHCGACEQACPAGDRCRDGACELDPCEGGTTECEEVCV